MGQEKPGLTSSQRCVAWVLVLVLTGFAGWFLYLQWESGGKNKKDQVFNNAGRYLKKRHDAIRKPR